MGFDFWGCICVLSGNQSSWNEVSVFQKCAEGGSHGGWLPVAGLATLVMIFHIKSFPPKEILLVHRQKHSTVRVGLNIGLTRVNSGRWGWIVEAGRGGGAEPGETRSFDDEMILLLMSLKLLLTVEYSRAALLGAFDRHVRC